MRNKSHQPRAPKISTDSVEIAKIIPGGQALGTLANGKKAMLWNALPGETVTKFEITKDKSTYLEGIALEIENPAPERIKPRDEAFLATSPWQIMTYDCELTTKRALVVEILRQQHLALGSLTVQSVVTDGQDYHYRNKMEYALYFDHDDQRIHLAFHARGSHRKIPISESSIERPEILARAKEIVKDLNDRHEDARKYQSLLLRANQAGETSGGLFVNGQKHPTFANLTDTILGQAYSYSPNGFFQINLPVYELALREMQKWVLPGKVLDLYAGVGTIGLSIARDHELTLVECDKSAYQELERNVQGIKMASRITFEDRASSQPVFTGAKRPTLIAGFAVSRFCNSSEANASICFSRNLESPVVSSESSPEATYGVASTPRPVLAKSEEALDFIAPDQTVILDPPRAGCHQDLIEKLLAVMPERIIYLSCNPITQARDVTMLQEKYQIEFIQPFNFFPRTPHIENLIVLTKRK